jgi:hypothetical protein
MQIRPIRRPPRRTRGDREALGERGTPEGDKFDILVTLVETYEERRCGH